MAWRRFSIAGELIDDLAGFVLDNDGRVGILRPALCKKFIYYFTRSFDGGLIARQHSSGSPIS